MIRPRPSSWKFCWPSDRTAPQPKCGQDGDSFIAPYAQEQRNGDAFLLAMIRRLSEAERSMALQRLKEAEERIAKLEAGIQRLKENGQPTVEAERLLRLLRRSHVGKRGRVDRLPKKES